MASNREERFLMRQRGAGARQLQTSGFDFDLFGPPNPPLKPVASGRSRRTPRSGSQPRATTRRTPKVTPALPARTSRRTPASRSTQNSKTSSSGQLPSISEQQNARTSQATKADERGTVTKKRKLAGRPRTNSLLVYEEPRGAASIFGSVPEMSEPIESGVQRQTAEVGSPLTTSSKKRKKRKSIGQKSKKRTRASLPDDQEPASEALVAALAEASVEQRQSDPSELETTQAQVLPAAVEIESPKRKRRKRKSIGAPRSKRKSLDVASSSLQDAEVGSNKSLSTSQQEVASSKPRKSRGILASVQEEPGDEDVEAPSTSNRVEEQPSSTIPTFPTQPRRRGRPRKTATSISAPSTTIIPKASNSNPRAQKRSAKPNTYSFTTNPSEPRQPKQKDGTIPITVHRISHTKSHTYDPTDEDILSAPPPFPKKSGVNAIDVLSQICREMISKSIGTLKQNIDKEQSQRQKAEWRRKAKVVEMFGDELDARLFQMTEAIDNSHGLTTRLRQANKTRNTKRDALLDIKRQREEIAIEMDAVGAQHEQATKVEQVRDSHHCPSTFWRNEAQADVDNQDENDLNTMIQDIELAVQRGRAAQLATDGEPDAAEENVGLELRLRKVAMEVSSVGGEGLLDRVRGFNALMEKVLGDAGDA
ncbi:hypothetical protein MMC11_005405 [Xylographa trunciseda]|nr:hypothetical protein [Xylographa trunciseda]